MENKKIYAQVLPLHLVHQTWEKVKPFVEVAWTSHSDECTADQALVYVAKGDWMVVVFADEMAEIHGAALVKIYNATNARIAYCLSCGGKGILTQETFSQYCAILKSMGATRIRTAGQAPIARLLRRFGYKELYRTVEVSI